MNYELAKQLKEAGFPQEPFWQADDVNAWGGSWYLLVQPEACAMPVFANPDDYKNGIERGDNLVKLPTPFELIEACGDGFALFAPNKHFEPLKETPDGRFTRMEHGQINTWKAVIREAELVTSGATPEEAVARLWLALNKNHAE